MHKLRRSYYTRPTVNMSGFKSRYEEMKLKAPTFRRPSIIERLQPSVKHHLFCDCNRCVPSVNHYVRKLKQVS